MARYIQDRRTGKILSTEEYYKLYPAAPRSKLLFTVKGVSEPFRSPVDGSIISSQKDLEKHNQRNNVVSAEEFSPEYYARKEKERQDAIVGPKAVRERCKDIAEVVNSMGPSPFKTYQQYVDSLPVEGDKL